MYVCKSQAVTDLMYQNRGMTCRQRTVRALNLAKSTGDGKLIPLCGTAVSKIKYIQRIRV